ncbi:MAG: undecaprenyldiphospho-muramoylpentapeptide beta-N-acetylglucosaminyltransferase [Sphingobacteriales bacterium]|nr:undecaprenyldiphospho-muramoylpentapeptide beta-N-acetylglucosaminyltransferase [Sphingobacteriales bacterium]
MTKEKNISTPVARQIIIAGGGTGGHIFPAIAIANAIKAEAPATNILFVGAKGKMEMEKVPQAGYEIEGLNIAGFNRSSLIKNIFLPFKLLKSFFQVRSIFNRFKPDAAIGVGGYSSFPVLKYAQNKGIPTFIHESNSFAGKSNKMLGKKATRIFTATPGMEKFFPAEKIQVTGNPVRQVIERMNISRDEAIHFFKLNPLKKTVLSLGGSLGAQAINEAIARHLDAFEKNDLQLIWQTGKSFKEKATEMADGYKNIYVSDFIMQMEYAYTAADIVISRSGAMALAELCLAKKPVVFVPYPFAAEDHQTANAKTLVDKSAALLVANHDAMEKLVPAVIALSKDEAKQQAMKAKIGNEARRHADVEIAKSVLSYINKN